MFELLIFLLVYFRILYILLPNNNFSKIYFTFNFEFIAPNKEEIPAKCKEKIARSTEPPLCACAPANGG
jgi:hypothetical protein